MALPEHVRQRLAEHAAKNKGRTNLNGLDRTLGLVALDWAQEQTERCGRWLLRADGSLDYSQYPDPDRHYFTEINTRYDEVVSPVRRVSVLCPWVRLSYAPTWLKEEFANRFPVRRIAFFVRETITTVPVHPLGPVCEFMRFLWPTDGTTSLGARFKRYITGYSANYIQRHPGVGAKVRIDAVPGFPDHQGEGIVAELTKLGSPVADLNGSRILLRNHINGDCKYEVIG